uniref:G_PROTEIN_RECEP_F3_4 domain-containing protein n=1 Tax=Macrostomum lignano TaxID=282301 RepID=A0A1I8GNL1_9PLAT
HPRQGSAWSYAEQPQHPAHHPPVVHHRAEHSEFSPTQSEPPQATVQNRLRRICPDLNCSTTWTTPQPLEHIFCRSTAVPTGSTSIRYRLERADEQSPSAAVSTERQLSQQSEPVAGRCCLRRPDRPDPQYGTSSATRRQPSVQNRRRARLQITCTRRRLGRRCVWISTQAPPQTAIEGPKVELELRMRRNRTRADAADDSGGALAEDGGFTVSRPIESTDLNDRAAIRPLDYDYNYPPPDLRTRLSEIYVMASTTNSTAADATTDAAGPDNSSTRPTYDEMIRAVTEEVRRRLEQANLGQPQHHHHVYQPPQQPDRAPVPKPVKIQRYTPNQDFNVWIQALEERCELNGIMDDRRKKAEVLVNLDIATTYPAVVRMELPDNLTFGEFKQRLSERFTHVADTLEYREQFRCCQQGKNESVDDYGDRLIALADRAFPHFTPVQKQAELVDQFTVGVRIAQSAREQLILVRPQNLTAARRAVLRLETAASLAQRVAPPPAARHVRVLEDDDCQPPTGVQHDKSPRPEENWLREVMEQQSETLQEQRRLLEALSNEMREFYSRGSRDNDTPEPYEPARHQPRDSWGQRNRSQQQLGKRDGWTRHRGQRHPAAEPALKSPPRTLVAQQATAETASAPVQNSAPKRPRRDPFITGEINGRYFAFLLDTGSKCEVLGFSTWHRLCIDDPSLRGQIKPCLERIVTYNGEPIKMAGQLAIKMKIGNFESTVNFLLAQGSHDNILGFEFLEKHSNSLDLAAGMLFFKNGTAAPLRYTRAEATTCRIYTAESTTVPPLSSARIRIKLAKGREDNQGTPAVIEPLKPARREDEVQHLDAAPALISMVNGEGAIEMINRGTTSIKVRANALIGIARPLRLPELQFYPLPQPEVSVKQIQDEDPDAWIKEVDIGEDLSSDQRAQRLSEFEFEIQHRKSSQHQNADGLSRRPEDDAECMEEAQREAADEDQSKQPAAITGAAAPKVLDSSHPSPPPSKKPSTRRNRRRPPTKPKESNGEATPPATPTADSRPLTELHPPATKPRPTASRYKDSQRSPTSLVSTTRCPARSRRLRAGEGEDSDHSAARDDRCQPARCPRFKKVRFSLDADSAASSFSSADESGLSDSDAEATDEDRPSDTSTTRRPAQVAIMRRELQTPNHVATAEAAPSNPTDRRRTLNLTDHIPRPVTREELQTHQRADSAISMVINLIESRQPKPPLNQRLNMTRDERNLLAFYEQLEVRDDGLLVIHLDDVGEEEIARIVLPKSLDATVLADLHGSPYCGHMGRDLTIAKVRERFWRPALAKAVSDYVASCQTCTQSKGRRRIPAHVQSFPVSVNRTTGFSPHYVVYGMPYRYPIDNTLDRLDVSADLPEYIAKHQRRLAETERIVRQRLRAEIQRREEYYENRPKPVELQPGDLVCLANPKLELGELPKFHRPYKSMYKVVRKVGEVAYWIRPATARRGRPAEMLVHRNNIIKVPQMMADRPQEPPRQTERPMLPYESSNDSEADSADQHAQVQPTTAQPDLRGSQLFEPSLRHPEVLAEGDPDLPDVGMENREIDDPIERLFAVDQPRVEPVGPPAPPQPFVPPNSPDHWPEGFLADVYAAQADPLQDAIRFVEVHRPPSPPPQPQPAQWSSGSSGTLSAPWSAEHRPTVEGAQQLAEWLLWELDTDGRQHSSDCCTWRALAQQHGQATASRAILMAAELLSARLPHETAGAQLGLVESMMHLGAEYAAALGRGVPPVFLNLCRQGRLASTAGADREARAAARAAVREAAAAAQTDAATARPPPTRRGRGSGRGLRQFKSSFTVSRPIESTDLNDRAAIRPLDYDYNYPPPGLENPAVGVRQEKKFRCRQAVDHSFLLRDSRMTFVVAFQLSGQTFQFVKLVLELHGCNPSTQPFATMAASSSFSRYDVRSIIKFSVLPGKSTPEIHQELVRVLGEAAPSIQTVRKWVREIQEGRDCMEDKERSGRPRTATTDSNADRVMASVSEDNRRTCSELEELLGIPHSTVHRILTENLGLQKLFAKWVPHLLTDEQMEERVVVSRDCLRRVRREGDGFLGRIVTGDETTKDDPGHQIVGNVRHEAAEVQEPLATAPSRAAMASLLAKAVARRVDNISEEVAQLFSRPRLWCIAGQKTPFILILSEMTLWVCRRQRHLGVLVTRHRILSGLAWLHRERYDFDSGLIVMRQRQSDMVFFGPSWPEDDATTLGKIEMHDEEKPGVSPRDRKSRYPDQEYDAFVKSQLQSSSTLLTMRFLRLVLSIALILCSQISERSVHLAAPSRQSVHILLVGSTAELFYNDVFFLNYSIDYVNSREDLFPTMQLVPEFRFAAGQKSGSASKAFIDGYLRGFNKAILLGATYSHQSQVVADLAQYYYLPQIGYSNTSPALSDKATYPFFIRMAITNSIYIAPAVNLLKLFRWKKIGIITTDSPIFYPITLELEATLTAQNITSYQKAIFSNDATDAINRLVKNDIRIFVVVRSMAEESPDKRFDCLIKKIGAYGPKYQWLQIGFPFTSRMQVEQSCPDSDRQLAMEGSIEFDSDVNDPAVIHPADITGRTRNESYQDFMLEFGNQTVAPQQTSILGFDLRFDAVMAAALAINATLADGCNYTAEPVQLGDDAFKRRLFSNVLRLDFAGLSGRVKFDSRGDRTAKIYIYQIRGGSAPVDSPRLVTQLSRVSLPVAYITGILSGLGACLAIAAMIVNLVYRKVALIRLSSPYVNTIIGLGCLLCYGACLVMTVNDHVDETLQSLCWLQLVFLVCGYSCAFGGMLAKTWRVHRIFTNKQLRKLAIKDWHLFIVILVILLLDAVILTAWGFADPYKLLVLQLKDQEVVSDGTLIQQTLTSCRCNNNWLWKGIIIGMKAIFLLFGIFFAWETRTVHVEVLNDSKTIGVCVYNTMVMGLIGVVLDFALPNSAVDLRHLLLSSCVIICSTTTVLLVFGGKIVALVRDRNNRVADANTVMISGLPHPLAAVRHLDCRGGALEMANPIIESAATGPAAPQLLLNCQPVGLRLCQGLALQLRFDCRLQAGRRCRRPLLTVQTVQLVLNLGRMSFKCNPIEQPVWRRSPQRRQSRPGQQSIAAAVSLLTPTQPPARESSDGRPGRRTGRTGADPAACASRLRLVSRVQPMLENVASAPVDVRVSRVQVDHVGHSAAAIDAAADAAGAPRQGGRCRRHIVDFFRRLSSTDGQLPTPMSLVAKAAASSRSSASSSASSSAASFLVLSSLSGSATAAAAAAAGASGTVGGASTGVDVGASAAGSSTGGGGAEAEAGTTGCSGREYSGGAGMTVGQDVLSGTSACFELAESSESTFSARSESYSWRGIQTASPAAASTSASSPAVVTATINGVTLAPAEAKSRASWPLLTMPSWNLAGSLEPGDGGSSTASPGAIECRRASSRLTMSLMRVSWCCGLPSSGSSAGNSTRKSLVVQRGALMCQRPRLDSKCSHINLELIWNLGLVLPVQKPLAAGSRLLASTRRPIRVAPPAGQNGFRDWTPAPLAPPAEMNALAGRCRLNDFRPAGGGSSGGSRRGSTPLLKQVVIEQVASSGRILPSLVRIIRSAGPSEPRRRCTADMDWAVHKFNQPGCLPAILVAGQPQADAVHRPAAGQISRVIQHGLRLGCTRGRTAGYQPHCLTETGKMISDGAARLLGQPVDGLGHGFWRCGGQPVLGAVDSRPAANHQAEGGFAATVRQSEQSVGNLLSNFWHDERQPGGRFQREDDSTIGWGRPRMCSGGGGKVIAACGLAKALS